MAFFPIVLNSEKKVVAFTHYVSIYSIFSTSSEKKEKLFESVCFKYYDIEQSTGSRKVQDPETFISMFYF